MIEALRLYKSFPVPPNLMEHQIKVASIVFFILDKLKQDLLIPVSAALLHDLGNLAKYNLSSLEGSQFCEDLGCLKYWRKQQEYIHKNISRNPDEVSIYFMKKANVSVEVINFLQGVFNFNMKSDNIDKLSLHQQVLIYADMRVSPTGIVGIRERNREIQKRYIVNPNYKYNSDDFYNFLRVGILIENIIKRYNINPEEISNKSMLKYQKMLYDFKIPTD